MVKSNQKLHYGVSGTMKPPCANCEERSIECHGKCEKYKEYRAKLDDVINKRNSECIKNAGVSQKAKVKRVSNVLKNKR